MQIKTLKNGILVLGDCLEWLQAQSDDSIDLIIGSPPYEDARTYGIDFSLKGQDWVDWMVKLWVEFDRVCKGLVCMVVEGKTRDFQWSATPALLMADLHRAGIKLRKPPIYQRDGIPGSGGPDWLKNKYEFIVCSSKGKLPWSNNTVCGHVPRFKPGGEFSYRIKDGDRVNLKKLMKEKGLNQREAAAELNLVTRHTTSDHKDDDIVTQKTYVPPEKANPGNIIDCGAVGGGHLGSKKAHENEAPFPEKIPNFFIKSFCPKDGIVLDPFSGSGSTAACATILRREFVAIDIRKSQIELTQKRLREAHLRKGFDL